MKIKVEHEAGESFLKHSRLELINHIGYIISTIIACMGLFNMEIFLMFADTYRMSIPIVTGIMFILITYFLGKTCYLLLHISDIRGPNDKKLPSIE